MLAIIENNQSTNYEADVRQLDNHKGYHGPKSNPMGSISRVRLLDL